MADRYDAVVIGAGPAGEVAAGALADGGMKVAIVERELVGGECGYWACIPSKTLLRPPEAVHQGREAPGAREVTAERADASGTLGWRDYMVNNWDDSNQTPFLDDKGIDLFRGEGRLDGPGRVEVGDEVIETGRVVVATGSAAFIPPIEGLDSVDGVWTNREVTEIKEVPGSIVIIGGGPVGVEMSQALQRLGAQVTLLDGSGHALPHEAPPAGLAIEEALKADGVDVRCGTSAESVAQADGQYVVDVGDGERLRVDKLLMATGRTPRVTDLGLDSVGVEWDEKPGFLTLVSDGHKLTGAYAVGPEAGEWLQQATLAIRAEVPLEVLRDTIQPFPTFSEAFVTALSELG